MRLPKCSVCACHSVQKILDTNNEKHPLADREAVSFFSLKDCVLMSYREPSMMALSTTKVLERANYKVLPAFDNETSAETYVSLDDKAVALVLDTGRNLTGSRVRKLRLKGFEGVFHMVGAAYNRASLERKEIGLLAAYFDSAYAHAREIVPMETFLSGRSNPL